MPKDNYQWEAAFVAFCAGAPIDEISAIFEIPLSTLQSKMTSAGWNGLRGKLPLVTMEQWNPSALAENRAAAESALPARINAKLEAIEANRQENLKVFTALRDHLIENLRDLQAGKLVVERIFHNKGMITRAEAAPGPSDWVNISTYARTIADGTYRALGDFQGQEKMGQDAAAGTATAPQPSITIILPGAIAQPRQERQVIDLTDLTPPAAPNE